MTARRFYVYADFDLLDRTGRPFYVGKGHGNRHLGHFAPSQLKKKTMMAYKMRSMLAAGNRPDVRIVKADLTEVEAFGLEIELIGFFGRRDLGTGCLCNQTEGGDGISGLLISDEHRYRISVAHEGMTHTLDSRLKMSDKKIGKKKPAGTKTNMRAGQSGNLAICSFDLTTDCTIKKYPSLGSVTEDHFHPSAVHHCLHGRRSQHKGVGWRLATPIAQSEPDTDWGCTEVEYQEGWSRPRDQA